MAVAVDQATAPGISSTKSSGSTCVMEAPLDAGSTQPTFAIAETVSLLNLITTGRGADTGFRGGEREGGGQVWVTITVNAVHFRANSQRFHPLYEVWRSHKSGWAVGVLTFKTYSEH